MRILQVIFCRRQCPTLWGRAILPSTILILTWLYLNLSSVIQLLLTTCVVLIYAMMFVLPDTMKTILNTPASLAFTQTAISAFLTDLVQCVMQLSNTGR